MRAVALAAALAIATLLGCGPAIGPAPEDPRGETNGRMFDMVSNKPDGSEWTMRLRGDSMWVAYSDTEGGEDRGPYTLTAKEARKVWELIDAADLPDLEEQDIDPEVGSVLLRLREPTGDGDHELIEANVPRDTEDEAVLDLADYLVTLIQRYTKVAPAL